MSLSVTTLASNNSCLNETFGVDKHDTISASSIFLIIVYVLVMLFVLSGNFLTILAVWKTPSLRTVPNMYVVSLAVADFGMGLILPYYAVTLYSPIRKELDKRKYICLFRLALFHLFVANSIGMMVAIAYDRFLCIRYPTHYRMHSSKAKAGYIITFIWILSLIIGVVPLFHNRWTKKSRCKSFEVLTREYRLYGLCSAFFICCILAAAFYIYIIIAAVKFKRRHSSIRFSVSSDDTLRGDKWKSLKMFFLVLGVFFVCWVPNFTLLILGYIWHINTDVIRFTVILGFVNSGMNFIIYAWKNKRFREAFESIIIGMKQKT